MTQYTTKTDQFLNTNRHIYEVMMLANNANGDVVSTDNPLPVTGTLTTVPAANTISYVKIADDENLQLDATERLRVSQSLDSWWYAPTIDADGDYRYIESSSGTSSGNTFIQNLSSVSLSPGTDNGGTLTRISRKRHKMRPDTSIRYESDLNWNGYDTNVRKRAGLFTNFNGVFFQIQDDLTLHIRRRLADGTLLEKIINRADFNIDTLDGTISAYDLRPNGVDNFSANVTNYVSTSSVVVGGTTIYNVTLTVDDRSKLYAGIKGRITGISPSTFNQIVMVESVVGGDNSIGPGNIIVTMLQNPGVFSSVNTAIFSHSYMMNQFIMGFDFDGSRMGKIRFFVLGLKGKIVFHIEQFGDVLSTPWSNAPAVSSRYEITNLAAPGYRPSLLVSSETVTIEGTITENPAFGIAYNNTPITYTKTLTQEFPVLGVALRAGEPYQRADLLVNNFQLIDISNINPQNSGVFFWRLLLNPTIGGTVPSSTNVGRASRQWAYTDSTTFSGGLELLSGYATQSSMINIPTDKNFVNLGSNIAYDDSDKLVLVVKLLTGGTSDSKLIAQMNFIELL